MLKIFSGDWLDSMSLQKVLISIMNSKARVMAFTICVKEQVFWAEHLN